MDELYLPSVAQESPRMYNKRQSLFAAVILTACTFLYCSHAAEVQGTYGTK